MRNHKDIRIRFTIRKGAEERRYEAVGFLNKGEVSINGDEMLARTAGKNGGAIDKDDSVFLREHIDQKPAKLKLWKYCLVTNWRIPNHPRSVLCFPFHGSCWNWHLYCLDGRWGNHFLVLRRLPARSFDDTTSPTT